MTHGAVGTPQEIVSLLTDADQPRLGIGPGRRLVAEPPRRGGRLILPEMSFQLCRLPGYRRKICVCGAVELCPGSGLDGTGSAGSIPRFLVDNEWSAFRYLWSGVCKCRGKWLEKPPLHPFQVRFVRFKDFLLSTREFIVDWVQKKKISKRVMEGQSSNHPSRNQNAFASRGSTPYWSPETSPQPVLWLPELASSQCCCMMQPRLAAGRPFLRPLHQERKTAPVPRTHRLLVTGCGLVGIERVGLVGWFQVGRWGGLWKVPRKGREGLQFQSREPPMWLGSRLRLPPRISVICWRADDCHRAQFQGMENSFIQTSKQTKY